MYTFSSVFAKYYRQTLPQNNIWSHTIEWFVLVTTHPHSRRLRQNSYLAAPPFNGIFANSQILGGTWPDTTRVSPRSLLWAVRLETLGTRLRFLLFYNESCYRIFNIFTLLLGRFPIDVIYRRNTNNVKRLHKFNTFLHFLKTFSPSAFVRVIIIFAGPTPPELTADTLITYVVYTPRLLRVVVFVV